MSIPTKLKVNLFQTTCLSVLLYGCESWTLTQRLKDKLNSFTTSCSRIILGVKRLDFIRNEDLLRQVKQKPLILEIHWRHLKFLGHILRKPTDEPINKYAFYQPRHGKRKPGRPKAMFHQHIAKVINSEHPPLPEEMRWLVQDRNIGGKSWPTASQLAEWVSEWVSIETMVLLKRTV